MNKELFYDTKEIAEITGCDPQTIRETVNEDIASGENRDNWNARRVGNKLLFSKAEFNEWMHGKAVGPAVDVTDVIADLLIRLGMAVEEGKE